MLASLMDRRFEGAAVAVCLTLKIGHAAFQLRQLGQCLKSLGCPRKRVNPYLGQGRFAGWATVGMDRFESDHSLIQVAIGYFLPSGSQRSPCLGQSAR